MSYKQNYWGFISNISVSVNFIMKKYNKKANFIIRNLYMIFLLYEVHKIRKKARKPSKIQIKKGHWLF